MHAIAPRACLELTDLPRPPSGKTGWPWTAESATVPTSTPEGSAWPRLTIVTPSFNQAEYLEATIRSVLLQGYPNLEYILIDGGSTDGSPAIIDRYADWLSYAVSEPDGGQYYAIDKGFDRSTGDVMTWLNSDDMLVPDSLWAAGGIFGDLADRVEWLTGVPAMWDRNGSLGLVLQHPNFHRQLLRIGSYDGVTLNFLQQEGTFWSRRLWEQAGGRLETALTFAADYELWCRLAEYAELYAASRSFAGFRVHPGQKTASLMTRYMEDMATCRAVGPWGWTERFWLARGVKRRVARMVERTARKKNTVVYDPGALRWRIT
jgi:glycosyltransferase involved in cell wall biosynthesis